MPAHPTFRRDLEVHASSGSSASGRVILKDPVSGKYYYLSRRELELLQAFDGTVDATEALDRLARKGMAYDPEECESTLNKAAQLGLLLGTKYSTARSLMDRKAHVGQEMRRRRLAQLYFLFLPLLNPDRFLEKTLGFVRLFANRVTAWLILAAAPGAIYLVLANIPRIEREFLFFFNWSNLVYLWLTILVIKMCHEFAHAYAAKSFGLRVPQMGIAFLIFFPCLYCNTTDAWQLADRRQRIVISAAGILVEAAFAVIATYVWYFTKPGVVNSIAFFTMGTSLVSTVLFNGNPLLRFDGYFMLMDYLEIPNLATRSFQYVRHRFMQGVLGLNLTSNPATDGREAFIFGLYGVSAVIYRIFLYSAIVIGVYYRFDKAVGIVLAVIALVVFVIQPLARGTVSLMSRRNAMKLQWRGVSVLVLIVAAGGLLVSMPISRNSIFPCYLDSETSRKLTIPVHTTLEQVFIEKGSHVKQGDVMFDLDTSELALRLRQALYEQRIAEEELRMMLVDEERLAEIPTQQVRVRRARDMVLSLAEEMDRARNGGIAPFDGIVTNLDDRFEAQFGPGEGVVVGEIECPDGFLVKGLIPEKDIHKVRVGAEVDVWFRFGDGVLHSGTVHEVKPYSEQDLKDSPFSSRFGGEVATEERDPHRRDVPLEALYQCSVRFPNDRYDIPLGMTGKLVVRTPPRSIARRIVDGVVGTVNRESLM